MWGKRWTMKEGFLIGAGLIIVGLMLEISVGPVVWDIFEWPVNITVLAVFIAMIIAMYLLKCRVYAFRYLMTFQAAIPAMCYAVVLTIIMGLTRQSVNGQWLNNMLTFWPFVLIYVYMAVIIGLVILKESDQLLIHRKPRTSSHGTTLRRLMVLMFHLGLFITMTTATLGNADMQRLKMYTAQGEPEWRALDQQRNIVELPLAIELQQFIMEVYDDGSPKRYASEIRILTQSGKNIHTTVDVNKPVEVDGWKIYQYGYDDAMGPNSRVSIFELVSDPWLPYVYCGIYMMLAAALLMFITGVQRVPQKKTEKNSMS